MDTGLGSKVWKKIQNIWLDENGYIFDGGIDVFGGLLILLIIPIVTLVSTYQCDTLSFSNYIYPIITVCFADMYDSVNRFSKASESKKFKLKVRIALAVVSFLSALFVFSFPEVILLKYVPGLILLLDGILLSAELYRRARLELILWVGM